MGEVERDGYSGWVESLARSGHFNLRDNTCTGYIFRLDHFRITSSSCSCAPAPPPSRTWTKDMSLILPSSTPDVTLQVSFIDTPLIS